MTDETPEFNAEAIRSKINENSNEVNRLITEVSQYGVGEPDFTGVRVASLIKMMVQLGMLSEEQYLTLNLDYSQQALNQMRVFAADIQRQVEEQRTEQIRQTLLNPGIPPVNGQPRRPH